MERSRRANSPRIFLNFIVPFLRPTQCIDVHHWAGKPKRSGAEPKREVLSKKERSSHAPGRSIPPVLNSVKVKIRSSLWTPRMGLKTSLYFSWVLMMIKIDFYFGFGRFWAIPEVHEFFENCSWLKMWEFSVLWPFTIGFSFINLHWKYSTNCLIFHWNL